jgi:type I restriction enzyme S subunit
MNKQYQKVRLGDVLKRCKDEIRIQDFDLYTRLTIRMNGKGIILRDKIAGGEIGTKLQFTTRAGQLLLSKIDARNGAFGIVPPECNGAIITGNFWAFDVDIAQLDSRYLNYLTRTSIFVDYCYRASEGTTNRSYLQEGKFLSQELLFPPLEEQRRIVARIEELAAKIEEARGLREEALQELCNLPRKSSIATDGSLAF